MTLPSVLYLAKVDRGELILDPQQLAILTTLDSTFLQLIQRQKVRQSQLGQLRRKIKPRKAITGLYLWGSVGIGKTAIMDLFYNHIPVQKMRVHFHAFMRDLHQQLRLKQGQKDPLKTIAKSIADNFLVICFDEFFVSNITDAMLLGKLFQYLFAGGLCLITTSNIDPEHLYADGIQRERFLPTIAMIQANTHVIQLDSARDYRLTHIKKAGIYHTPTGKAADTSLEISFIHFTKKSAVSMQPLELFGRQIKIIKQAGRVIWFDFQDLCSPPRSQNDYLALSQHFDTIMVSNIPPIAPSNTNQAILLINLIDILYDAHIRLIASAEKPIHQIYPEGKMAFEFKRTESRLTEMNTFDYFMQ